jgi:hypothetical protein
MQQLNFSSVIFRTLELSSRDCAYKNRTKLKIYNNVKYSISLHDSPPLNKLNWIIRGRKKQHNYRILLSSFIR